MPLLKYTLAIEVELDPDVGEATSTLRATIYADTPQAMRHEERAPALLTRSPIHDLRKPMAWVQERLAVEVQHYHRKQAQQENQSQRTEEDEP